MKGKHSIEIGKRISINLDILVMFLALMLVPQGLLSLDIDKPKLAKKYIKWLEEEVIYIITPVEKEVFSKLVSDKERDLFIEEFWKQRDPTPGTARNEFKEEHFRRIEFANKRFGRETPLKGWRTDRGKFYIKLGSPTYVERYINPDIFPIEIWYYSGNPRFIRTPFFRLLFFQRHGAGEFELYSHTLDGPRKLVANIYQRLPLEDTSPEPDEATILPSTEDLMEEDARALKILEREVSFELADAALSAIPGRKGEEGLMASQVLMGEVDTLPYKRIDDDYAIEFLEHKAIVEVSYSVHYIGNQHRVNLIQDPSGLFFVNYVLVPNTFGVDFFKDKYFTNLKTSVRVSDEKGTTIFQGERNTPVELRPEELKALQQSSFHLHDAFPLIPGNYTMNLLWENMVTKEFTSVETKVTVPELKGLRLSSLVLARKVNRDLPPSQESRAFQIGKLQIYPSVNNTFSQKDSLFVFLQVYGLNEVVRRNGVLEFSFSQGAKTPQTKFENLSSYNSDRDFLEEFSLEELEPGDYTLKVSLLDQEGARYITTEEQISIITQPVRGAWVVAQTNPPMDDPYFAYVRGVQYLNMGEVQQAQIWLANAHTRKPEELDYALSYVRVLLTMKSYSHVKEILLPFVEAGKKDFGLFYSLGSASQAVEEFAEAITYYQSALQLKGNITLILNAMGECYLKLGETEQALRAWQRSLEVNPKQEDIKKRIAEIKKE